MSTKIHVHTGNVCRSCEASAFIDGLGLGLVLGAAAILITMLTWWAAFR
jgi:hypothetical protein